MKKILIVITIISLLLVGLFIFKKENGSIQLDLNEPILYSSDSSDITARLDDLESKIDELNALILAGQLDILRGQTDILSGQMDLSAGQSDILNTINFSH